MRRGRVLLVALTVPTLLATLLAVPNVAVAETRVPFVSTSSTTSCGQWNVQGTWISAATNGYHVTFRFAQSGTSITGTATNPPAEATIAGYASGTLSGTLVGNHFRVIVVWAPRASDGVQLHGLYDGTVTKGHIAGLGTDLTTMPTPPSAAWSASGPTTCALGLGVTLTGTKGSSPNTLDATMTLTNTGSGNITGLTFSDPSGLENDGVLVKKGFLGPTTSGLTLTSGPSPALPTALSSTGPPVVVHYVYSTDTTGDAVLVVKATATDGGGASTTASNAVTIFVKDPPATEAQYDQLVTSVLLDADTINYQGQNTLANDEASSLAAGLNLSGASPGQQESAVQLGFPGQLGLLIGDSALARWTGTYVTTLASDLKGGLSYLGQTGTAVATQLLATAADPQARDEAIGRMVDGVIALPTNVQKALASQADNLGYLGAALAATNSKNAGASLVDEGTTLLDTMQTNTNLVVSGFPAMVAADNAAYAKNPTGFIDAESKQYADATYGLVKTELATVLGDGIFKGVGAAIKAGVTSIPATAAEASKVDSAVAAAVNSTASVTNSSVATLMQNADVATSQFQTLEPGTPLVTSEELGIGGMTPGDQAGFQKSLAYIDKKYGIQLEVGVRTSEPLSVGIDGSPKLSFMKPKAVSSMDMLLGGPSQIDAYTAPGETLNTQKFAGGVTTVFKPVPLPAATLDAIGETNPAFLTQYNARLASQTKLWNEYQNENSTLRVLVKGSESSDNGVTAIANVPGYPVPAPPAGAQPLLYLQQLDDPAFVQQFGLSSSDAQSLKASLSKSPGAVQVDYIARPNPDGSVSFFDGLNNNRPFVSDTDLQYYQPANGAPWPAGVTKSKVQQDFLNQLQTNLSKLPDHGASGTAFDLPASSIGVADAFTMGTANPAFAQGIANNLAARYASQSAIFSSNAARLTKLAAATADPAEAKALLDQAKLYSDTAATFSKVDAAYLLAKYPPGEKIIVIKLGDVRVGYGPS